jgi:hypothetical protein
MRPRTLTRTWLALQGQPFWPIPARGVKGCGLDPCNVITNLVNFYPGFDLLSYNLRSSAGRILRCTIHVIQNVSMSGVSRFSGISLPPPNLHREILVAPAVVASRALRRLLSSLLPVHIRAGTGTPCIGTVSPRHSVRRGRRGSTRCTQHAGPFILRGIRPLGALVSTGWTREVGLQQ